MNNDALRAAARFDDAGQNPVQRRKRNCCNPARARSKVKSTVGKLFEGGV